MAEPLWLDDVEMAAWRSLLRSHAALLARLDRDLHDEHGMSLGEYEVLAHLSEEPEQRLRLAELAERVLISPSALTRRVDRLVQRGWVERQPCRDDARGMFAVLTAEGRQRLEEAAPTHVQGVRCHLVDRLSRGELKALAQALSHVAGEGATPP